MMSAVIESMTDGLTLVDGQGNVLMRNTAGAAIAHARSGSDTNVSQYVMTNTSGRELRHDAGVARLERDRRLDAGGGAGLIEGRADTRATRHADDRVASERAQPDGRARRERMPVRDRGDERLVDDHDALDPVGPLAGEPDDGEVELAGAQAVDEVVGVGLGQRDLDGRVRGVEPLEEVRHVRQPARDDHPDGDPPADEAAVLVDRQPRPGHGLQRGLGVREERLADRGETHGPPRPVEQRLAELALEPADLGADARLGDVGALRAARKAPFFGDRDEVRELAEFHNGRF